MRSDCIACGTLLNDAVRCSSNKSRCKPCGRALNTANMRKWRGKNREKVNANQYARSYPGFDFDAVFKAQGERCAICGTTEPGGRGQWATDHDHSCCPPSSRNKTCGKCVRGILCNHCNVALGYMNDDPERLLMAIEYLTRSKVK